MPSSAVHSGRNGSHTKRNLYSHEFVVANEATKQQTRPVWQCAVCREEYYIKLKSERVGKKQDFRKNSAARFDVFVRHRACIRDSWNHDKPFYMERGKRGCRVLGTKCNFQTIKCTKLDSLVNLQVLWRWKMVFIYHYLAFHSERMPSHCKCMCETERIRGEGFNGATRRSPWLCE